MKPNTLKFPVVFGIFILTGGLAMAASDSPAPPAAAAATATGAGPDVTAAQSPGSDQECVDCAKALATTQLLQNTKPGSVNSMADLALPGTGSSSGAVAQPAEGTEHK